MNLSKIVLNAAGMVAFGALFVGCAFSPADVGGGGLFTSTATTQGGLVDYNEVDATKPSKEGKATCYNILGIVVAGDCSVSKAAKDGNITKIKSVDRDYLNVLWLYNSVTTIVRGE